MSHQHDSQVGRTNEESTFWTHLTRTVFGDQYGVLIFLISIAFFGLLWRVGFLINDNYTIANALYNVANGHLPVTEIIYGPESGTTPGMVTNNGHRYGRNYGQIFLTLPVVYLLRGLTTVADLQVILIALWSTSILAISYQFGRVINQDVVGGLIGSGLAIVVFVLNLTVATELSVQWVSLLSLQITSIFAAALVAVIIYRLLARMYTTRVGLVAGLVIAVATPVGYWATIPKRHTYMALVVVATLYSFYRSRETADETRALRFRALAYAFIGLSTWLQAGEALVLFVALVSVDLLTADSNTPRNLALVGGVFGLSLVPFMLTNLFIAGNPFTPPLFLPRYRVVETVSEGAASSLSSSKPGPVWITLLTAVQLAFVELSDSVDRFTRMLSRGMSAAIEPTRLYQVFIRGGYIEEVASRDGGQAVNLSLLESAPLFAAVAILPRALVHRIRKREFERNAVIEADLLVVTTAVLFALFYLPRLPLHVMITVRYLLPIMPLFVYCVFRLQAVRELLQYPRTLGLSYLGVVAIGGQVLLTVLLMQNVTAGEATQIHAWLHIGAGLCLVVWLVLSAFVPERFKPVGAVLFGITAGLTTVFLLLSSWFYFALESGFALPLVGWLSELFAWF